MASVADETGIVVELVCIVVELAMRALSLDVTLPVSLTGI